MATNETVYEFGDFRLDVRERRLLRDGQPAAIICCSSTSRRGASSCAELGAFLGWRDDV